MKLTVDQALKKGIEAHRAGRVQEADRYYTAILKINPHHSDANHNMGVLAVDIGKVQEALPFFKTALDASPKTAQFWLSYINTLIELHKMSDAEAAYHLAVSKVASDAGHGKLEERFANFFGKNFNGKELTNELLKSLTNLLSQGKYQQVLNQVSYLLLRFSSSVILYNFSGAANQGLGNTESAIESYKKALSIQPDYVDAYYNMGIAYKAQGKLEEAIKVYKKVLSIRPQYAEAHYNMGNIFKVQGKLEAAIRSYRSALSHKPDYVHAYNNLGTSLREQGRLEEAIEAYTMALSIKPDYADASNNLGNAIQQLGKPEEAIVAYTKAISLNPNHTDAWMNMGSALQEQDKLSEAIESYKKALSINPNYADAWMNMGLALQEQGRPEGAIQSYTEALLIKSDYAEACINMGNALKGITFNRPNRNFQKAIEVVLDYQTAVRPMEIAKAVISLLKLDPLLQKHLQSLDRGIIKDPLDVVVDLSKLPLLLKFMRICPIPDLEIERLLTDLRCSIIKNCSPLETVSPKMLEVQSALALQCFTNEYIYNTTTEEEKRLQSLDQNVRKSLDKNEQPNPQVILTLASYKALKEYDWYNLLVLNDHLKAVFIRQVEEPEYEEKLKIDLPILTEIIDKVSSKVREQYEESPYPRWVNLGLPLNPITISELVNGSKLKLHDGRLNDVEKPEILIAGCGTGQHSIGTAARFRSSNVLAVDLSLSSLAYAKRKTDELGIVNIDYMQADILELNKLNKRFDIIESAGVLHHMDDPFIGWKILSKCLKPGGLMYIGLYSETARQSHIKIRKEIYEQGIGSSNLEMKLFREKIITSSSEHHKKIRKRLDFYSSSTLRDLLFHVKEHRFTLHKIQHYLKMLGLEFCGFEARDIVSHFRETNLNNTDLYNLDRWHEYEVANPNAFAGMYQFWCQKID